MCQLCVGNIFGLIFRLLYDWWWSHCRTAAHTSYASHSGWLSLSLSHFLCVSSCSHSANVDSSFHSLSFEEQLRQRRNNATYGLMCRIWHESNEFNVAIVILCSPFKLPSSPTEKKLIFIVFYVLMIDVSTYRTRISSQFCGIYFLYVYIGISPVSSSLSSSTPLLCFCVCVCCHWS